LKNFEQQTVKMTNLQNWFKLKGGGFRRYMMKNYNINVIYLA